MSNMDVGHDESDEEAENRRHKDYDKYEVHCLA